MPMVKKLCLAEMVTWGMLKKDLRILKLLVLCPSGESLVRNSTVDAFPIPQAPVKHSEMCLKNILKNCLRIYFTVRS